MRLLLVTLANAQLVVDWTAKSTFDHENREGVAALRTAVPRPQRYRATYQGLPRGRVPIVALGAVVVAGLFEGRVRRGARAGA